MSPNNQNLRTKTEPASVEANTTAYVCISGKNNHTVYYVRCTCTYTVASAPTLTHRLGFYADIKITFGTGWSPSEYKKVGNIYILSVYLESKHYATSGPQIMKLIDAVLGCVHRGGVFGPQRMGFNLL